MSNHSPTDRPTAELIANAAPVEGTTWSVFSRLIRLRNQSGTLLLMLPTFWALVLASRGHPPVRLLFVFAAGAFIMRSAGVIMNDLADRSFDRQVTRTRSRPLASGEIRPPTALVIVVIFLIAAAGLLTFLNPFTILLSPIALILAAVYPLSKRLMHIPQAMLGIAFGWGVIMAWASVETRLSLPAWLLYGATICWAVAYDSIYALQDREDDRRVGVKSSAVFFGSRTWMAVAVALTIMLLLLGLAGWMTDVNGGFYGVLIAVAGFLSQQISKLRGPISATEAFTMFTQHVWVGWAILGGAWLGFL
jgi:4-hydroxybenzoate polyprenyltransferase